MTPVLSYHSDPDLKAMYVARAQAHRAADEVVQGRGWDGTSGCCIGCLAHDYPAHVKLARDIGADEALFYLADKIHESLPGDLAKTWPERFATAIPVGADLSRVRWRFLHWLLTNEAVNPGITHEAVRDAVKDVADLCLSAACGEMLDRARWLRARSAAAAVGVMAPRSAMWSARSAEWSDAPAEAACVMGMASGQAPTWISISEALLRFLEEAACDPAIGPVGGARAGVGSGA